MKKFFLIIIFSLLIVQIFAQSHEVPFTLEDRDRIMRTEEKVDALREEMSTKIGSLRNEMESLRNEMNARFEAVDQGFVAIDQRFVAIDQRFVAIDQRFEAIDQRFEALESKIETLYWGFGILIAIMLFLFGYIVWDRRTALNPVQTKTMSLEERVTKLEMISKQQASKDPDFAELLRHAGLL
jgi:hypothetical protein